MNQDNIRRTLLLYHFARGTQELDVASLGYAAFVG